MSIQWRIRRKRVRGRARHKRLLERARRKEIKNKKVDLKDAQHGPALRLSDAELDRINYGSLQRRAAWY
ncbi:MAG: hypothetical protein A3E28_03005 [Candidatus Doudnabacteria bacterium RIFCSPHIGHO2_12_FULL_42_22]|uniref:Uncharacterized protein n=1 Tax=Candidatus Doudnabacteria bacterium RIFCSPHIGHO2_01_FULL_41_86 TaxID=1817821 RepID=A0A1F5N7T4_9BACT|nr:MAG: hypothetical protein A2717_03675 [Candidatus Doudnabacteria bacterium RIFCSPHIGHO2_01_FULL_41_86]OGE85741.1 MAG: hypothetical protein A3E28_03005 [Candidatus Doudnabacteria bacterium RIFCSPHIGHO2_12_FULL_42_22]